MLQPRKLSGVFNLFVLQLQFGMLHLSDNDFAEQFAHCTLEPTLFTHEAHLRLAWLHVTHYGVLQAIQNICPQIAAYDKVFGDGTKYHKTVTIASVFVIDHFIHKSTSSTFENFIAEFPRLRTHFRDILSQHYSTDIVKDARAKTRYFVPDLQPFDSDGFYAERGM